MILFWLTHILSKEDVLYKCWDRFVVTSLCEKIWNVILLNKVILPFEFLSSIKWSSKRLQQNNFYSNFFVKMLVVLLHDEIYVISLPWRKIAFRDTKWTNKYVNICKRYFACIWLSIILHKKIWINFIFWILSIL